MQEYTGFMDNHHCPKCGGPLHQRIPKDDQHLIVHKENVIRFWCPCGYYKDEIIEKEVDKLPSV
jgi:hypothetical protein